MKLHIMTKFKLIIINDIDVSKAPISYFKDAISNDYVECDI